LDDLITEMKQMPAMFNDDLHILIRRYGKDMRDFLEYIHTVHIQ